MTTTAARVLLNIIGEPIDEDRIVLDCPTCSLDRDFDDPAECPDCAGARYIVA